MKKTLLITGASKGIGRATAALFLEKGYRVVNLSRSAPNLSGVVHIPLDLADAHAIPQHSDSIVGSIQDSDIIVLIHNAAMMVKDTTETVTPEIFQQVFQLNVIAATQINQIVLPKMKPGSSILYVASTLAEKAASTEAQRIHRDVKILGGNLF